MEKTIMDTICSSYDSFFESEKKIAKYMINHYDKVVDMTVRSEERRVGKECGS